MQGVAKALNSKSIDQCRRKPSSDELRRDRRIPERDL
jgi:hypothetical protein